MVRPALSPVTTVAELLALPEDGQRHELLDGVHAVTPSPTYHHQDLIGKLQFALLSALIPPPTLRVLASPANIILGPRTLVQPDLFVVRIDPDARLVERWSPADTRPEIITERLTWTAGGEGAVVLELAEVFGG